MFERGTRCWRRDSVKLTVGALLLGLAGCNPVETYRHLTGIAANDPNPVTTPNTRNLAAGEAIGYPNLATVPPPPSRALTTAELDKLTKSLIADRTQAKETGEHLDVAANEAALPSPPPPPLILPSPPSASAPAPSAAPSTGGKPPAAPAAAPGLAPIANASGGSATPANGPRKAGEPPEPGPLESSLKSPQIAGLPLPEQNRPAPPLPSLLTLPTNPGKGGAAPGAHLSAPSAAPALPPAIASAQFQPAPPPPKLPPAVSIRAATAKTPAKPAKPAPPAVAYAKVAEIAFAADETALTDADRQTIAEIMPRYHEKAGPVRVVGYAGIKPGAAEQLDSYRTALDRARAVAAALTRAGIPAGKIATEAAPTGGAGERGRAEILFGQ
jgi:outer membrane protein OmpA-like peptidoglycan-associated protein